MKPVFEGWIQKYFGFKRFLAISVLSFMIKWKTNMYMRIKKALFFFLVFLICISLSLFCLVSFCFSSGKINISLSKWQSCFYSTPLELISETILFWWKCELSLVPRKYSSINVFGSKYKLWRITTHWMFPRVSTATSTSWRWSFFVLSHITLPILNLVFFKNKARN